MHDVVVIGGGLAGWRAAEAAVKAGCSVALIANGAGNSPHVHALNCPVLPEDSAERMFADTMSSGHGTNDPALVRVLCEGAVRLKDEFAFDRNPDGSYKLIQPLGSSVPRCVMIGPAIGAEILQRIKLRMGKHVDSIVGTVVGVAAAPSPSQGGSAGVAAAPSPLQGGATGVAAAPPPSQEGTTGVAAAPPPSQGRIFRVNVRLAGEPCDGEGAAATPERDGEGAAATSERDGEGAAATPVAPPCDGEGAAATPEMNIEAHAIVLATGGWCGRYAFSTNPPYLKGDGIRFAEELGAAVVDMDKVQYEPTAALYPDSLRGIPVITTMLYEGATFRNKDGNEFLPDARLNKDVLSKAILSEINRGGGLCPYGMVSHGVAAAPSPSLTAHAGISFLGLDHFSFNFVEIAKGKSLPHWTLSHSLYHVCFRLADSVPSEQLRGWLRERRQLNEKAVLEKRPLSDDECRRLQWLYSEKVEKFLDAGHGACLLRNPDALKLFLETVDHDAGIKYDLYAIGVMPNHVHVVLAVRPGFNMGAVMQTLKSVSSHRINKQLGRRGAVWQADYYSHIIRTAEEYSHQIWYVGVKNAGVYGWSRDVACDGEGTAATPERAPCDGEGTAATPERAPCDGEGAAATPARASCDGEGAAATPKGVWYDATAVPRELLEGKYGPLVKRYASVGIDVMRQWMLVAPAPHTSLGGVCIDTACRVLDAQGAPIAGFFAAGEVTGGLHGANRLGGNAGTEILVFGKIAGESAAAYVAAVGKGEDR